MDQSKSNNAAASQEVKPPKRTFSVEFFVGIFTMFGVVAGGYLAVGLGDVSLFGPRLYQVHAEFSNIAGLKTGASVEIAGVQVGRVTKIELNDPDALVTMSLVEGVKLRDDDIAMVRTKGIIGDRYIKISRGGSENFIAEGGKLSETESAVDIEEVIGKVIHSLGSGDAPKSPDSSAPAQAAPSDKGAKKQ